MDIITNFKDDEESSYRFNITVKDFIEKYKKTHLYFCCKKSAGAKRLLKSLRIENENMKPIVGSTLREFYVNFLTWVTKVKYGDGFPKDATAMETFGNDFGIGLTGKKNEKLRWPSNIGGDSGDGKAYIDLDLDNEQKLENMYIILKKAEEDEGIFDKLLNAQIYYAIDDGMTKELDKALAVNRQVIFTGAPGTGKTYAVREYVKKQCKNDQNRFVFIQFHPSYDYTDFVEGIRPVPANKIKDDSGTYNGATGNAFVKVDGTFKAFCRKVVNEEKKQETSKEKKQETSEGENKYYFVIDEINRADLSKVFGELMFCLESSYRGSGNAIPTQYQNLPTYQQDEDGFWNEIKKDDDVFQKGFYIPENVYLIGTMNDIDRSVESFDFALRRRFQWINISANEYMFRTASDIQKATNDAKVTIDEMAELAYRLTKVNNKISELSSIGLSEEYHFGATVLKAVKMTNGKVNVADIFTQNIKPTLMEYLRGYEKRDAVIKACEIAFTEEEKDTDDSNAGKVSKKQVG